MPDISEIQNRKSYRGRTPTACQIENSTPARRPIKARDTKWAHAVVAFLIRLRLTPNAISLASVGFAGLAGLAFWTSAYASPGQRSLLYVFAAVAIQLRLLCNLFDGMVAVEGGFKTKSGEIFNELPDRFSDVAVLVGCGYASGPYLRGPELGAFAALLALITAYVRALGAAAGAGHCFFGPMAKPHRMATMTIACVGAAVVATWEYDRALLQLAMMIAILGCVVTIWRRIGWIVRELEAR